MLTRLLQGLLDLLPIKAGVIVIVAGTITAAAWIVAALRVRAASAPAAMRVPGRVMPREEALGHLRRVKAELKGRKGEAAVAEVLARAGLAALHDVVLRADAGGSPGAIAWRDRGAGDEDVCWDGDWVHP